MRNRDCAKMTKGVKMRKARDVTRKKTIKPRKANFGSFLIAPTELQAMTAQRDWLLEENDRLARENWALKQALGYPIPAQFEMINNPWKCGICEARTLAPQPQGQCVEYVTPNEFRRSVGLHDIETLNEAMDRLKRDYRL